MSASASSGDPTSLLTIGELADFVGVSVRAIRHYHQRGLLPEPGRDASGYRRYDARAVLDLMRIKVLADAGVPLARIDELAGADPQELAELLGHVDQALRGQIRELELRRRRIAELARGERTLLPKELAGLLEELDDAGVSARTLQVERDGWLLLLARDPEHAPSWLADKRSQLADPELLRLYLAYDQAGDMDPDDPRLQDLAEAMVLYGEKRAAGMEPRPGPDLDGRTAALVGSLFNAAASPAQERLVELVKERSSAP
jgi:DNA-binding transcriptional MerR regulator